MNMHRLSSRLLVLCCLAQLFSCQKQIQTAAEDSLEFTIPSEAAVYNEYSDCKLRAIVHRSSVYPDLVIKGTFVYNPDGLPDNLTYADPKLGNLNYYFIYDNQRRLKELQIGYQKSQRGDGVMWHRYGYNNLNQIVKDTLLIPSDTESATRYMVATLTYDNEGRIRGEQKTWYIRGVIDYVQEVEYYDYDSRGNLIVPGASATYDDKVSIFRSHPLFQFIHRNYSKNNAAPQAKYNFKGLPLSNIPSNDVFFNAGATIYGYYGITTAIYDCDGLIPTNEFLNCKLRTITHETPMDDGPNAIIKGTFVYHPDGLPDNLTYPDYPVGYYFIYDNKRRLTELRYFFSKTQRGWPGAILHRYGYNSAGQIITDTIVGAFGESESISTLSYDAQGRVSKEDRNYYHNGAIFGTRNDIYKYDARGNLIVDGWPSSSYDDKVSIYRSHSLFQFIHRNYSKNNASAQTKYNSKGLPLSSKSMNGSFFNPYNGDDRSSSSLISANYDCR